MLAFTTGYVIGHRLPLNSGTKDLAGAVPSLKENSSAPGPSLKASPVLISAETEAFIAAGADVALKVGLGLTGVAAKAAAGAVADAVFPAGAGLAGVAAKAAVGAVTDVVLPASADLISKAATGLTTFAFEAIDAVADTAFKTVNGITGSVVEIVGGAADAAFKIVTSLTSPASMTGTSGAIANSSIANSSITNFTIRTGLTGDAKEIVDSADGSPTGTVDSTINLPMVTGAVATATRARGTTK